MMDDQTIINNWNGDHHGDEPHRAPCHHVDASGIVDQPPYFGASLYRLVRFLMSSND
jgi:hypothetical protein